MKDNMDAIINFRLPSKVKEKWKKNASEKNMCLGDYIRTCVSNANDDDEDIDDIIRKKPTPKKAPAVDREKADPALIQAVARCGNNINQIARSINSGRSGDINILLELQIIKSELAKYVNQSS